MSTNRMTIESTEYVLAGSVDVADLQLQICEAMRCGGGIVTFDAVSGRTLTAIVSPGVPVMFESVDSPAEERARPLDAADTFALEEWETL